MKPNRGSAESPLQFYVDRERFDCRMTSTIRHNHRAGVQTGGWCAERPRRFVELKRSSELLGKTGCALISSGLMRGVRIQKNARARKEHESSERNGARIRRVAQP